MKNSWPKKIFLPVVLVALSFIPLFDLLHAGLPLTHDGQDHVARIANFYQSLVEGVIVPRWGGNLNWGYGHPVLMFLYPMSSYLASLFHFLSFSFVDSTKLVFAAAYIASGLTMYLWLSEFLGRKPAFLGSILYIFAPYRFVDLYVRGAIGEHVAFVFPPLVLFFLLKLQKKFSYKYLFWGSISLGGMILAHNAISLMFLPIIFVYAGFLLWQSKSRLVLGIHYLIALFAGFAVSAFFWAPAFFEGKYTLRDIVTKGGWADNFASLSQFIYGNWSYGISGQFSLQVGIVQWLMVILSIPLVFYFYKKRDKLWFIGGLFLVVFILSLFIMEKNSYFVWEKISLIQKFQFPWRFLSVTVFASSVLGAIVVEAIPKKYTGFCLIIMTFLILFLSKDYWHANSFLEKPESFYTSIYHGTTDTGESAPVWSVRFMEKEPKSHVEVIGGKAQVRESGRKSTEHYYFIDALTNAKIRENTLYFPGWEVLVDGKNTPIEFQDMNNRGVITFDLQKGKHNVEVRFVETKLRLIADIISMGGLVILVLVGFYYGKIERRFGNI